jgi:hypothetical protein
MIIQFTRTEKWIIRNASLLRIVGWGVTAFGVFGIPLGLYANYFREWSVDARALNNSLLAYSIGFIFIGRLLTPTITIIIKFVKKHLPLFRGGLFIFGVPSRFFWGSAEFQFFDIS